MVSECEETVRSAETLGDLLDSASKIDELKNYQIPEEFKKRLEEIENQVEILEDKIDKLPELIDELTAVMNSIKCESLYDRVYLAAVEEMRDNLLKSEAQWIERIIVPVESGAEMDAQQCTMQIGKKKILMMKVLAGDRKNGLS